MTQQEIIDEMKKENISLTINWRTKKAILGMFKKDKKVSFLEAEKLETHKNIDCSGGNNIGERHYHYVE